MERLMDKNALMECIYVANDRTRTPVVNINRFAFNYSFAIYYRGAVSFAYITTYLLYLFISTYLY